MKTDVAVACMASLKARFTASAAIAMASRRGLGKAKHMHVQYLWIQELIQSGEIKLEKVGTDENRSDLMTKHLQAPRMKLLMRRMGFQYVEEEKGTNNSQRA